MASSQQCFQITKLMDYILEREVGGADHQQCDFWYRFYEIASIMPVACASALPAAFKLLYTDFICEL